MKILYVTTISLTMNSFFKPHIRMLVEQGHQVDIACNDKELPLAEVYKELGCKAHTIDFSRSPLSPDNAKAYGQLKRVVEEGKYDIVHCHTPNASVITRLVCRKLRKQGLKVFYTAHGFHFYKGAPKLNWLVFYPVEKLCSRWTDRLITINKEDFELAKARFKAGEVCYVPGVGIDLSRFQNVQVDSAAKRREIGVPEDAFLLLSVGELNENKNHQIIVRAMAQLQDPKIHYAIAGIGEKKDELLKLAEELGIGDRLHLLGYRKDVAELYHAADVFCFPSIREGLGLAAVEAMACGTPVIAADNRGTRSFIRHGENGFMCPFDKTADFAQAIVGLHRDMPLAAQFAAEGRKTAEGFALNNVLEKMSEIYSL